MLVCDASRFITVLLVRSLCSLVRRSAVLLSKRKAENCLHARTVCQDDLQQLTCRCPNLLKAREESYVGVLHLFRAHMNMILCVTGA